MRNGLSGLTVSLACLNVSSNKLLDISRLIRDALELVYNILFCACKAVYFDLLFILCRIPFLWRLLTFSHNLTSKQFFYLQGFSYRGYIIT